MLNRKKTPAYVGTLVNVRGEDAVLYYEAEDYEPDKIEIIDLEKRSEEEQSEVKEPETAPAKTEVSSEYYARYRNIIAELKSLVNN